MRKGPSGPSITPSIALIRMLNRSAKTRLGRGSGRHDRIGVLESSMTPCWRRRFSTLPSAAASLASTSKAGA